MDWRGEGVEVSAGGVDGSSEVMGGGGGSRGSGGAGLEVRLGVGEFKAALRAMAAARRSCMLMREGVEVPCGGVDWGVDCRGSGGGGLD